MTRPNRPNDAALSERAQLLFKALVERHIRDGIPVGSRTLVEESGIELSSATVRNVLADLESLGLIRAPHTSAGRVPTDQGYRLFVDTLLTTQPIDNSAHQQLQEHLSGHGERPGGLIESASRLLSGLTHMAAVVTLPRHQTRSLARIEFVPLDDSRVLAILVLEPEEVQNRILHVERSYSRAELDRAASHINQACAGLELTAVRSRIESELHEASAAMDSALLALARQAIEQEEKGNEGVLSSGEINLMDFGELSEMSRLRKLFEALDDKRALFHLLDRCLNSDGVQIFIGDELGNELLAGCSIVTAPYGGDGRGLGVLGVIGPTRMAYQRVVPVVDVTARLLGAALNPGQHG